MLSKLDCIIERLLLLLLASSASIDCKPRSASVSAGELIGELTSDAKSEAYPEDGFDGTVSVVLLVVEPEA